MKQYSIKDIAKLSGVSIATVSRVINNKGKYSQKTKEKVLSIIKKTGYEIDASARSLRTNITKTIAILVPDITNPFFADLVQKIEKLLFDKNYSIFICNTDKNVKKERTYLQRLATQKVDGIIVISGSVKKGFQFESSIKQIPYVCIDRSPQNFNDTIFISSNHYQGAIDATNFLIKKGVNHPVLVTNLISPSTTLRFQGFKDALKQNNMPFKKSKNFLSLEKDNDLINFLKRNPQIDGIFASDDNIAIRTLQILKKLSIVVPDQIQLIGFDNIPATTYVDPPITTISQNTEKIAVLTVQNILSSINGEGEKGSKILVPTKLIIRKTTKNS